MMRLCAAIVLTVGIFASTVPDASAYATTGNVWGSSTVKIDIRGVPSVGVYRTALNAAIDEYHLFTDLYLYGRDESGLGFTTHISNYGNTGWEGQTSSTHLFGRFLSSDAKLNRYYLDGASLSQVKVVWLHEIGHGLGLAHVSGNTKVMYTSASQAYFNGTHTLTSDEINGINSLY